MSDEIDREWSDLQATWDAPKPQPCEQGVCDPGHHPRCEAVRALMEQAAADMRRDIEKWLPRSDGQ